LFNDNTGLALTADYQEGRNNKKPTVESKSDKRNCRKTYYTDEQQLFE
jgi:hypothetical protein